VDTRTYTVLQKVSREKRSQTSQTSRFRCFYFSRSSHLCKRRRIRQRHKENCELQRRRAARMFFSHEILGKRSPLATVWIAAHMERKLRRKHIVESNVQESVGEKLPHSCALAHLLKRYCTWVVALPKAVHLKQVKIFDIRGPVNRLLLCDLFFNYQTIQLTIVWLLFVVVDSLLPTRCCPRVWDNSPSIAWRAN
jgi:hypothetical protein